MSKIRTGLRTLLSWVVYLFSHVVPRNPALWVFYGWHTNENKEELFADNSKYAFLFSSSHGREHNITSVWIGTNERLLQQLRDKGYKAVRRNSVAGIWFALRAGYTFIDAYLSLDNWRFTGRSRIVQLWHAIPIKKLGHISGYTVKNERLQKLLFPHLRAVDDILITTSAWETRVLTEAYPAPNRKVVVAGHTRNDVIRESVRDSDIDVTIVPYRKCSKKILYCPTYRLDSTDPLEHLKLERLVPILRKHTATLYVQLHPKLANYEPRWSADVAASVCFLRGSKDVHPVLHSFDICISDYSSLCFDFLFLDRPILYYQYDLDAYEQREGLQDSYKTLLAGPQILTFDQFQRELEFALGGGDLHAASRERVRNLVFTHYDSNSAARVFKAICEDAHIEIESPVDRPSLYAFPIIEEAREQRPSR